MSGKLKVKAIIASIFLSISASVMAQDASYPNRPIKIVVPFPPGGGIDLLIRAVGKELTDKWGQPIIIENKAGAATFVGAEYVANSPADGYTLLATTDPTFTSNRHLFAKLPYDPDKSFEPIIQLVKGDNLILANSTVPLKDLKELVASAKKPGANYSFSSYGNGTQPQLVFGYLNKRENIDLLHVPYKGIAPAMTALIGKEVDLSVASAGVAGEMIKAGQIKPLAVAGKKRMTQYPDVPTTTEQGFPYLQSFIWYGVFAPAGTPANIVNKLNAEIALILKDKTFSEKFITSKGMTMMGGNQKEFIKNIKDDTTLVGEMVKSAGIKPE